MGNFWPKFNDENYRPIGNLPNEIMVEIFSYLDGNEKVKVSLVNKRWFQVANNEIQNLSIKWPQQQNQDVQNLINRLPKLKNLELASMTVIDGPHCTYMMYGEIINKDSDFLPVDFFEFTGTLEFDIYPDLIPTKSCENRLQNRWFENPSTSITRIKINPAKDFLAFVYNKIQIINFEIDMRSPTHNGYVRMPTDVDTVVEEILSLENVSKIRYSEAIRAPYYQQEKLKFVKIVRSILSRPHLKQIEFNVDFNFNLDIENEFPKNFHVEGITLRSFNLSFKVWKKVFDALPNIREVEVVTFEDNLVVILKTLSNLKYLKFLHVTISNRDHIKVPKIRDCFDVIRDNFPMKTKVVVADMDLNNLIEREEGKEPKLVICQSRSSRYYD